MRSVCPDGIDRRSRVDLGLEFLYIIKEWERAFASARPLLPEQKTAASILSLAN